MILKQRKRFLSPPGRQIQSRHYTKSKCGLLLLNSTCFQFTYHSGKDIQDGQESQRENSTTITTTKTKFSTSSSSSSSFATPPRKTPPQYAMVVATPPTARKLRQPTQSPVPMHEDSPRYRTPPQSPFQPAFYRTPKDTPDTNRNPSYKLPNQKTKTSTEVWMEGGNKEDAYDGDTEF